MEVLNNYKEKKAYAKKICRMMEADDADSLLLVTSTTFLFWHSISSPLLAAVGKNNIEFRNVLEAMKDAEEKFDYIGKVLVSDFKLCVVWISPFRYFRKLILWVFNKFKIFRQASEKYQTRRASCLGPPKLVAASWSTIWTKSVFELYFLEFFTQPSFFICWTGVQIRNSANLCEAKANSLRIASHYEILFRFRFASHKIFCFRTVRISAKKIKSNQGNFT